MSRRFDEREVEELLRRATEPRGTALARPGRGAGLTLEEVKEIAVEAGIDPARIDDAADALGRPVAASRLDLFVGSATNLRLEARYDVHLDDDGAQELVRLIRASLGRQGVVGGRGGDLEWMDQDGYGSRNVNAYGTASGTTVQIIGSFRDAGAGAAGIAGVTGTVGAIAVGFAVAAGPVGLLLAPVTLAAALVMPRLTIGRAVRRETQRLVELSERIRDFMRARSAEGPSESEEHAE